MAERSNVTLRSDAAHPQAGQPVHLSFKMPQRTLEYVHERPIHLMFVSADLAEFEHVHPEVVGDTYEIAYTFPHGGHYRAYAHFTPPGADQRIEAFDFHVEVPNQAKNPAPRARQVKLHTHPIRPAPPPPLPPPPLSPTTLPP